MSKTEITEIEEPCVLRKTIHLNVDFTKESTFKGRSVEDGLPVTKPIYDLEELLTWTANDSLDPGQPFSVAVEPYYGKDIPKGSTKTLVCHDMAGGYLDDRFVQGKLCTDDKWYYLVYWDVIDIFVYFSHHFVTIPPVGWINSAHRNGVAVLGTFIAEGNDGFKRCDAIFSHESAWRLVANQLVNIAKYYRFEGWLLNIETEIRKKNTKSLQNFVGYLTDRMHDAIEGSQVIWYDSVTDDGELAWQNKLNSRNKVYFDHCDGIFLNYGWDKADLEKSAEVAIISSRVEDVYVGVDVFGRGCYGGGGMNSAIAVELIRRFSLSTAIFAPGWVKEVLGAQHFEENQTRFWSKLAPYCRYHPTISPHPYFYSKFHPGIELEGIHRYLHLSQQSLFPHMSSVAFLPLPALQRPHELAISRCSDQILFSTKLPVERFDVKEFSVYLKIKNPKTASLDIKLKCGKDIIAETGTDCCEDTKTFSFRPCSVEEILCSTADEKVDLEEFILTFNPLKPDVLGSKWLSSTLSRGVEGIDLSLDDISWKKTENSEDILLSCTLIMERIDTTLPISVFYRSFQTKCVKLGVAYCDRFCINDLHVPDPVHSGPNTKIVLEAKQENPIPFALCQKYGFVKVRCGELDITYGEKTCGPRALMSKCLD